MIQQVIKKLATLKRLDQSVEKYTDVTDEDFNIHGILVFIPLEKYDVKVLIPSPHHKTLFESRLPTYGEVLRHREAMLLR